ncbi:hypothetical protein BKA65DRAFT_477299 [Rhexocercosporidium sp. MPI-PUGE-AT-0058]|nr:hypothetical protein BKA65DRAFT_477299 [Rhexocercosporidium sp. MPI-PUGE-AT-0058]
MSSTTTDTECPLSDCRKAKRNVVAYKKLVADTKTKHEEEVKKLKAEKELASRITSRRIEDSNRAAFGTYGTDFEGRGELQKQLTAAQTIASVCKRDHAAFTPEFAAELANTKAKLGEQANEIEKLKQEKAEKVKRLNEASAALIPLQREQNDWHNKYLAAVNEVRGPYEAALQRGDSQLKKTVEDLEKAREHVKIANEWYENHQKDLTRVQGLLDEEKRSKEKDVQGEKDARKSEVAALKAQLEGVHKEEVAALRSEIRKVRENAVELVSKEKDARKKEVDDLKAELEATCNKDEDAIARQKDACEKEILQVKAELERVREKEVAELKTELEKTKEELEASEQSEQNVRKELENASKLATAVKTSPPTPIADTKTEFYTLTTSTLIEDKCTTVPEIMTSSSTGETCEGPTISASDDDQKLNQIQTLQAEVEKLMASVKLLQKQNRARRVKEKAYNNAVRTSQQTYRKVREWDCSCVNRVGKIEYLRMKVLGMKSEKAEAVIAACMYDAPIDIRNRCGREMAKELFDVEDSDDEDDAPIGIELYKQRRAMREEHERSLWGKIDEALMAETSAGRKRWDREMFFTTNSTPTTAQTTAHSNTAHSTNPNTPVAAPSTAVPNNTQATIQIAVPATTGQANPPTSTPVSWSIGSVLGWIASYWL